MTLVLMLLVCYSPFRRDPLPWEQQRLQKALPYCCCYSPAEKIGTESHVQWAAFDAVHLASRTLFQLSNRSAWFLFLLGQCEQV